MRDVLAGEALGGLAVARLDRVEDLACERIRRLVLGVTSRHRGAVIDEVAGRCFDAVPA